MKQASRQDHARRRQRGPHGRFLGIAERQRLEAAGGDDFGDADSSRPSTTTNSPTLSRRQSGHDSPQNLRRAVLRREYEASMPDAEACAGQLYDAAQLPPSSGVAPGGGDAADTMCASLLHPGGGGAPQGDANHPATNGLPNAPPANWVAMKKDEVLASMHAMSQMIVKQQQYLEWLNNSAH